MSRPARKPANRQPAPPRLWNIRNAANTVPVIELFGDIGQSKEPDWFWGGEPGAGTFQEFADELKSLGNVPELRVEIHSYGGSVVVGKAIHDKLAEHPANKTAVIYGICASAATYPALACQTVRIPANSFFLIHNSSGCCYGEADDMRSMADMLDIADESIANLYAARTGKSVDEIFAIMDADTWMTGAQAVAMGLATEVIDPITIEPAQLALPDNFRRDALNTMPHSARAWFDTARLSNAKSAPPPAMLKPSTPLFNKAADTPPAGGGVTPPPTPVVTNTPVVPPVVTTPPPVTTPAPTNGLTMEEMRSLFKEEMAPMNKRLEELEALRGAGVGNKGWGNNPPVEQPKNGEETFPQNAAELEIALTACKTLNERVKMNNEFKKRKAAANA